MVRQYPHTCTYRTVGTPSYWDEVNGGYIPETPGLIVTVECRAIPSGSGKRISNQDGVMVEYRYDLAFPVDVVDIPRGQEVTIEDSEGHELVKGNLLNFASGQLHKRGWL